MLMRPAVDNRVFANADEMRKHYAEVHKRIYDRPQREQPEQKAEKTVIKFTTIIS